MALGFLCAKYPGRVYQRGSLFRQLCTRVQSARVWLTLTYTP